MKPTSMPSLHAHIVPSRVSWRDYLALTKPRVISLLLFTTLTSLFVATDAQHRVTLLLFCAVAIGGYMAAGAANAINMVIDRDIDARMLRTAQRPTVTQEISARSALLFALALATGSFLLLYSTGGLLCALMAQAGLAFYVVIYTLLLKRRTWHNIVIGGAAGAFPPLVGYAAVAHHLNLFAWLLFAVIFFWTPVHFWALALLIKDDYARADIPMLPVVRGDRATVVQIAYYTVLTVAITLYPWYCGFLGGIYLISSLVLNAALVLFTARLFKIQDRPRSLALFKYSMLYLALLFLAMAIDHSIIRV